MKRLSPGDRAWLLNEMMLSSQFNTKAWSRRFGISPRQVRRLRAEAREILAATAANGPVLCQVKVLNIPAIPSKRVKAA
jgi:hypothetical protein